MKNEMDHTSQWSRLQLQQACAEKKARIVLYSASVYDMSIQEASGLGMTITHPWVRMLTGAGASAAVSGRTRMLHQGIPCG